MAIVEDICEAWGWKGIQSAKVIAMNKFGNVMFTDQAGKYWRICPEELECKVIADCLATYEEVMKDQQFAADWEMARLVNVAEAKYGVQPVHRCFCLKTPGVLGGAYDIENVATIRIGELIRFSGDVARQIKDLPPGSKIQLRIVD
jgi:hypothetical protein